jgi:hypothetical protein
MTDMLSWAAPLLAAAVGLIGIFIDRSSRYFNAVLPIFVLAVVLSAYQQWNDGIEQDAKEKKLVNTNKTIMGSLQSLGHGVEALVDDKMGKILEIFGMTPELGKVQDLDKLSDADLLDVAILNRARIKLLSSQTNESRAKTEIRYYAKERDNTFLRAALIETGLTVENEIPKDEMSNAPTNAVWHGKDVPFDHFKLVVVSLMRAKIPIHRLGPSCKNQEIKRDWIEVGASDEANALPVRTLDSVLKATTYDNLDDKNVCR